MEELLARILEESAARERYLVALAGPPAAGKSTLSGELVARLPRGSSIVVPLDGFHYDNLVLDQLGLRARKGSPESFDYEGFAHTLRRIRAGEGKVAIPLFDREIDLARAGAALIDKQVKVVVVEGNYLLLDEMPWSSLEAYFDLSVFLEVPREELRRRLMQRWADLDYSEERARHWVETNDMPNIDRVLGARRKAHLTLSQAS